MSVNSANKISETAELVQVYKELYDTLKQIKADKIKANTKMKQDALLLQETQRKLNTTESALDQLKEYLVKGTKLITICPSSTGVYVTNISPIALYVCFHKENYSEKLQWFHHIDPSETTTLYAMDTNDLSVRIAYAARNEPILRYKTLKYSSTEFHVVGAKQGEVMSIPRCY